MKPVALVGFQQATMRQHLSAPEDAEIWTLNYAWCHRIPKINRLFEIHAPDDRMNGEEISKEHDDWLQERHMFPIYTLPGTYEKIPSSVAYPWDEVTERFCGHLLVEDKVLKVFTSTFDYMIALALFEGFNPIYLYGFAMAGDREHGYQRDGFCYWSGYGNAMGVDVIQVKESTLLRPKVYHLGGQMYSVRTIMLHRDKCEKRIVELEKELLEQRGAIKVIDEILKEEQPKSEIGQNDAD